MQLNNVFKDWLSRRKITDEIIRVFGIHESVHPTLGLAITIPISDKDGHFLFNKYRRNPLEDIKPKYVYDKGSSVNLFAAFRIKDADTVLITEGEMDCLVAWSCNIPAVSSTGGALTFRPEWAEYLEGKNVIICFDNDPAGGEGMAKALAILPKAKLLFLPDRPGIKDISDYVSNGGDLNALITTAVALPSVEDVIAHRADRISVWQSTYFHDAYMREYERRMAPVYKPFTYRESDKLLRAKEFPIDQLLKFKQNKICCLFHTEKTESLHYYPKTNTCYCFGSCGKRFDSIDIYQKLSGCSFKEAVNKLSNTV